MITSTRWLEREAGRTLRRPDAAPRGEVGPPVDDDAPGHGQDGPRRNRDGRDRRRCDHRRPCRRAGETPATIYRAINDLGEVLELDQGDISFRARKYREELRALVESAEYAIESYADRMQHIMGLADHVAESSPFQEWLAKNGADLEFDENGEPRRMRIDTILSRLKADSFEDLATIASEALEKWSKVRGTIRRRSVASS